MAFENVGFGYLPDVPVLRAVSFRAEPGQRIALVGPTGAGKTTFVSLIPRFFDPSEGRVLIDGHDLAAWYASHWDNDPGHPGDWTGPILRRIDIGAHP